MASLLQRRRGQQRGMVMKTVERIAIWSVLAATLAAGCNSPPVASKPPTGGMAGMGGAGGIGGAGGMGGAGGIGGAGGQMGPPMATYAGVYDVKAPFDLTKDGVLPGLVGPTLEALSDLHEKPGTAIIELLIAANISGLSDALAGL